jgi:exopolysaccharide production protein ExoQ
MGFLATAKDTDRKLGPAPATPGAEENTGLHIPWLEQLLLFLALAVFFSIGPADPTPELGKSNLQSTLGQGAALAITVPFVLLHWRGTLPMIIRSPLLVSFIALAIASVAWSALPELTFRRDASLMAPILVGLVAAYRYEPEDVVRFIGRFCLLLTVVSLVVVAAFPAIGIMHDAHNPELDGAWRGFTPHKSVFGTILVLGFQIYAWRAFFESKRRWLHVGIAVAMMAVCFLARSSTAFIAMSFSVLLLAILAVRRSELRMRFLPELAFWGLLIIALLFLPFMLTTLVHLLGKDISLTGRIPLWQSLMPFIADRPLIGYGYGTFWVANSPQMILVQRLNPWNPPDAHNAYIGVALELGLPGAIIATGLLLSVIFRAYRTSRSTGLAWPAFLFAFAFVYAITNMVETPLLSMGNFFTFMLAFCHFALVRPALGTAQAHEPALARGQIAVDGAIAEPGLRFRRVNNRPRQSGRGGWSRR